MIDRIGQTSASFFKTTQLNKEIAKTSVMSKTDTYVPTSSKSNLWNYSLKEVKSSTRSFSISVFSNNPDWSKIPTKGMRTLSYEQIFNEMKNLAQRQVMLKQSEVRDSQWEIEWDETMSAYVYLKNQYVSDVSPDRKALYKQAKNAIKKMKEEGKVTYPTFFTLVDFLCDLDDLEKLSKTYSGMIETAYTTGYGTDYIIHFGGEEVMRTMRGEWVAVSTVAEQLRAKEFNNLFEKLYDQYKTEFLANKQSRNGEV